MVNGTATNIYERMRDKRMRTNENDLEGIRTRHIVM